MKPYLDLCQHVMDHGMMKMDRTKTGTKKCIWLSNAF